MMRTLSTGQGHYVLLDHTADVAVRVFGQTRKELFENAALALADLLTDPYKLEKKEARAITVEAGDLDGLWVNWLREILYLFAGEKKLACAVQVMELSETRLSAMVWMDAFDPEKHELRGELKAVTYHQARVSQDDEGWKGTVVFDV